MLFVAYLINQGKKSSTVRSYVSAIKAVLEQINTEVNEKRSLITSLTQACNLKNDYVWI